MATEAHSHSHAGGHHEEHGFPWSHIIGFVISIVLTLIALWMVLNHLMSPGGLVTVILLLGILQILVQLFFFMHVTESIGPRYHLMALGLGIFFVFAIIAGSIWIMTFGGNQAY